MIKYYKKVLKDLEEKQNELKTIKEAYLTVDQNSENQIRKMEKEFCKIKKSIEANSSLKEKLIQNEEKMKPSISENDETQVKYLFHKLNNFANLKENNCDESSRSSSQIDISNKTKQSQEIDKRTGDLIESIISIDT